MFSSEVSSPGTGDGTFTYMQFLKNLSVLEKFSVGREAKRGLLSELLDNIVVAVCVRACVRA